MKGNTRKNNRHIDAKRTAMGRFLCRLMGDESGQALMEYVVLGVLVVAAVVGLVVAFGDTIGGGMRTMIDAIVHPNQVPTTHDGNQGNADQEKARGDGALDAVHDEGGN